MKTLFFLLFSCSLQALSIVFVHLGDLPLPPHLFHSVSQARLFNPKVPIYLIGHAWAQPEATLLGPNVIFVPAESLPPSPLHQKFSRTPDHLRSAGGLWIWSLERFFYLDELIAERGLTDVFHLENDVMIYTDLEELLPIFHRHYQGMIGATFEKDNRCVPGFFYISNGRPLRALIHSLPSRVEEGKTDMHAIADFKNQYQGVWIDFLPITFPEYFLKADVEFHSKKTKSPEDYSRNLDHFGSVFDASALGVYLGGWDAKFHEECTPGQISQSCVFDVSCFTIEWEEDSQGRRIPFLCYEDKKLKINNLHITNKGKIEEFSSQRKEP